MSIDERIIENNRSQYCVFFANSKGWEVDEIKEIFSAFGEVTSVRCAGDKTGYRFVEFNTLEEAKSAVEGLEYHPDITLKKHHKKDKNNQRQSKKFDKPKHDSYGNNNKSPRRKNFDNGNNVPWNNTNESEIENSSSRHRFEHQGFGWNANRQEEQHNPASSNKSDTNNNFKDDKDVSSTTQETKTETTTLTSSEKKLSPLEKMAERVRNIMSKKENKIQSNLGNLKVNGKDNSAENGKLPNVALIADTTKKNVEFVEKEIEEKKETLEDAATAVPDMNEICAETDEETKTVAVEENKMPQTNEGKVVQVVPDNVAVEKKEASIENKMKDPETVGVKVEDSNDSRECVITDQNSIASKDEILLGSEIETSETAEVSDRNLVDGNIDTVANEESVRKVTEVDKINESKDLITQNNISLNQEKGLQETENKILEAAEVIVGNIHEVCTEAFLLYLFEKFEPIAISKKWTVPKYAASYCHVYFKTPEDAAAVERYFDKYNVSGRNLIVLRLGNLISLQI